GDLLKGRTPVVVTSPDPCDPNDVTSLALAPRAWVHLPLICADTALGFASFGRIQPSELSDEDVDFATAVASHARIALDRANLLGESRRAAETLQRALLPQIISALPGWDLAGRYIPAVEGTQVGGDWYDAFTLSGGGVGLVLGDVAGKGIRAAAIMGPARRGA